jgi:hypothetical protein
VLETARSNGDNIVGNERFVILPKIQNKATALKISQEIAGNSEKSIPFVDSDLPDSRAREY